MINFIIALFVKKGLLEVEEGEKLAKSLFGRSLPQDYEAALSFAERLLTEAKLSSSKKYFDPQILEKVEEKVSKKSLAKNNK